MAENQQLIAELVKRVAELSATVITLTEQAATAKTKPGTSFDEPAPKVNHKDVDKPARYSGDKWATWEPDFKNFLTRVDPRWKKFLDTVKTHSKKPLEGEQLDTVMKEVGIDDPDVFTVYSEQLYDYLKTYTSGDTQTMVLTNGPRKGAESWRRMCDQGRCVRERPMRDERRALYHPKQSTEAGLVKAIAEWERQYSEYLKVVPSDTMSSEDRIMCLEDMCPEPIQRYLAKQSQQRLIKSYEDYKDAIDEWFYEERRWSKSKAKLNAVNEPAEPVAAPEQPEDWSQMININALAELPSLAYLDQDDPWTHSLVGELHALVKGKFQPKGKGGKRGKNGGLGKGKNGDVVMGDASQKECYECGEVGHFGRTARFARPASRPAALRSWTGRARAAKALRVRAKATRARTLGRLPQLGKACTQDRRRRPGHRGTLERAAAARLHCSSSRSSSPASRHYSLEEEPSASLRRAKGLGP